MNMDDSVNKKVINYGRVMSRVYNRTHSNLKASSSVTRHKPLVKDVGAKPQSNLNMKSGAYSDLPIALNGYEPDLAFKREVQQAFVVKPKRTLKSLVPVNKPTRTLLKPRNCHDTPCLVNVSSAPSVLEGDANGWSKTHLKHCLSSQSHTRLKEIKDEIKEYQETEKLMKLRSRLYKNCGVVLNDVGGVTMDKAVQAKETDIHQKEARSEQRGQNAGTAVSYQQMRSETPRYPVDRYLVESSKTVEMVNIADDELWNPEPAIRPEDEIILRKLHEMLQSTADDLKLISGELIKCREPRVQVKTLPTPLDEEFNEKVHIEEIVNAKFHGYKIIEKSPHKIFEKDVKNNIDSVPTKPITKTVNAAVELLQMPTVKKSSTKKNLVRSRTNNLVIEEQPKIDLERVKLNNVKDSTSVPSVSYSEFSHVEPKVKFCPQKPLNIQEMPSINIRSELKEQKVLQLDIIPEQKGNTENLSVQSNVAVITTQHEPASRAEKSTITNYQQAHSANSVVNKPSVRRVSKIMTCESSESSNNVTSEAQDRIITQKLFKSSVRSSPKPSAQFDSRVSMGSKFNKNEERRPHRNIDEWNKKLNTIYGRTSTSKRSKTRAKSTMSSKKCSPLPVRKNNGSQSLLNNAEYIPYAKLTLGGVRVSDIEREISDIPDKTNIPLNPILDKILISRENSIHGNSPKRKEEKRNTNILTTSDENLLEEVLDIERNVATTLSKNLKLKEKTPPEVSSNISTENSGSDKESYADDFEEERSENGQSHSDENKSRNHLTDNIQENNTNKIKTNIQNSTFTKSSNLSFKNSVEVFEFIHSIDTQESATQSNGAHKISLKATQTSPRNVQPIRNDLWPSNDQANEGDKVMKEDFIKKLIVDECADILQKNLTKFSTLEDNGNEKKNFSATQKNTQTSPAHVKSVMTSPTKTKTRYTSPFTLSPAVDHQTSPIVIVESEEDFHIELDKVDDLAISINLSSPRFSLRLPQTSREVISNLDATFSKLDYKLDNKTKALKSLRKLSSVSSADADYSSSDVSSLGEINNKFKRRLRKTKIPTISESSASSTTSKYSSDLSSVIVPLRSEGEISFGQIDKGKTRLIRSDGEVSLGQT